MALDGILDQKRYASRLKSGNYPLLARGRRQAMSVQYESTRRSQQAHRQVTSRQITDFADFAGLFDHWNGQFCQMSRGQFRGIGHVVAGQVVRLFQASTNQEILTRGVDDEYATFIPITARNEATVWQGRRLCAGQMIVKTPEVEYHNQTARDTTIIAMLVPMQMVSDASRILTGKAVDIQLPAWSAPQIPPKAMERLANSLSRLLDTSLVSPEVLDSPEGHALEMECLRSLIEAILPVSNTTSLTRWQGNRASLVKRAIDFMHDHLDQPVTALELCSAVGASDRALRRAFREACSLGPLAYFRLMRLHAVRTDLKEARGGEMSVAEIATRWGFGRLGSFSNEYRRQFGELPSHTLGVRGAKTSRHGK
jgi:AraC family ethanolamine operon transcriptional activator